MTAPRTEELALGGRADSVPAARAFVREVLVGWGLEALADAAALVVSELATNAVLHARSDFTVRVGVDADGGLRLEVVDGSPARLRRPRPSTGASTGRGLSIVAHLADDWGVAEHERGKAVWVRLSDVRARQGLSGLARPASGTGARRRPGPAGPSASAA